MNPRGGKAHQVAGLLGMTARQFYARRAMLEAQHGFPAPLPGLGTVWDMAAVERWISTRGGTAAPIGDQVLADQAAELVRRARALGAPALAAE